MEKDYFCSVVRFAICQGNSNLDLLRSLGLASVVSLRMLLLIN